jgi:hypothetical protein
MGLRAIGGNGPFFNGATKSRRPNSDTSTLEMLRDQRITRHVFLAGRVGNNYINAIDSSRRVLISDPFNRQDRNADYPGRELFTEMNIPAGNPPGIDFGDFSIVGNYYTDTWPGVGRGSSPHTLSAISFRIELIHRLTLQERQSRRSLN